MTFFTRPQGETLKEATKPAKKNQYLWQTTQPKCKVSSQGQLNKGVQYATVTEPPKMKTVPLHVLPVKISSLDGKFITTYGLLDNGSRGTMISSDVAKELHVGFKGQKEMVSVSTLLQQEDEEFEVVEFKLQSASGDEDVISVRGTCIREIQYRRELPTRRY